MTFDSDMEKSEDIELSRTSKYIPDYIYFYFKRCVILGNKKWSRDLKFS